MTNREGKNSSEFIEALDKFDMTSNSGLVFVKNNNNNTIAFEERLALETAEKYKATAVYFRRFANGRPSVPQIYVYDYTSVSIDESEKQKIAELHKALWNSSLVPLFFIYTKTGVSIFNCHKQPRLDNRTGRVCYSVFREIKLASAIQKEIEEFSGKRFDNGSFWELSQFKDEFKLEQSVYGKLLAELKNAKNEIIRRNILPKEIAQKLLVMTILIKYLEERQDDIGYTVFPEEFFGQFSENASSFVDVLRNKGACLKLFDFLSGHFNGKIFEWKEAKERKLLSEVELNYFADFLEGKIDGKQYVLWPIYSFSDLPVELISNIYEDFLGYQPGVVYTPPYLVNFLVDEVLPLSNNKYEIKVIDPACGSGIFLVAVFRRLIERWRLQNNWQKPKLDILKKILKNNIYGVDINKEAIRLTAFSLSLTLCDMLSPKVIWEKLKFDNLFEKNLLDKDYFGLLESNFFAEKFDIVIGNPPFNSELTTKAAKNIEIRRQLERPAVPDDQLALLFLDQSLSVCKKDGKVCLILPAGPMLYNETSFGFRKSFLASYNVPQIIDFSPLNKVLFKSANVSAVAVFVENKPPVCSDLLHVTVRRTKVTKERLYFELDHYDFHKITYKEAIEDRTVWKANLLGGGRIKYLVKRLSCQRTLGQYLNDKVKTSNWKIGEGYRLGKNDEREKLKEYLSNRNLLNELEKTELDELQKKYKKASHITGKLSLPTEGLTEDGLDTSQMFIQQEKLFLTPRTEGIFKGPHILIRELAGTKTIPVSFFSDYLTFPAQIIGIHAPEDDIKEIKRIEERIQDNKLYLFYLAACSGRYMVSKQTSILKADIEKLPYPENEEKLKLTEIEEILVDDVLRYRLDFHQKGETSTVFKKVQNQDLQRYDRIYCEILNSMYKDLKSLEPLETDSFICLPFYFKEKPQFQLSDDNIELYLRELLEKEYYSSNLRILRILRIYHENVIFQVKPKLLRFWLPSIAVRDADETFSQLLGQGY